MGEEGTEEVDWDEEPVERTSNGSDSESAKECDESNDSEDEDDAEDIGNETTASENCIEISSDDERNEEFAHVFKEVCCSLSNRILFSSHSHILSSNCINSFAVKELKHSNAITRSI